MTAATDQGLVNEAAIRCAIRLSSDYLFAWATILDDYCVIHVEVRKCVLCFLLYDYIISYQCLIVGSCSLLLVSDYVVWFLFPFCMHRLFICLTYSLRWSILSPCWGKKNCLMFLANIPICHHGLGGMCQAWFHDKLNQLDNYIMSTIPLICFALLPLYNCP